MGTFLSTMPIMMVPIESSAGFHVYLDPILFHEQMSALAGVEPYELFLVFVGLCLQEDVSVSYCGSPTQFHQQYHRA